ncbi:hypothetical protein [Saccharopolyspora kobensis]|uniref:hypothetical protein n=1 Tax=Saccharopolyspora kobensis TaxID=146035 RepID=UPI001160E6D3|nr:hypothetical protein [Saccharopolyspora kobensis]
MSRAIVTTGRKYVALAELPPGLVDARAVETRIVEPIRALLVRGEADGTLRRPRCGSAARHVPRHR